MVGIVIAHHRRDDQGHGENVRTQAIVVKVGAERDVFAKADDGGRVPGWPRPEVADTIEHRYAEACRSRVQARDAG